MLPRATSNTAGIDSSRCALVENFIAAGSKYLKAGVTLDSWCPTVDQKSI
jgi:hypothetical protein